MVSQQTRKIADVFGLLSDPTRINILRILIAGGELCVTDIASRTGLSLSAASHQLRKLELIGLVTKCRYGQMICYCLNKQISLTKRIINLLRQASRGEFGR